MNNYRFHIQKTSVKNAYVLYINDAYRGDFNAIIKDYDKNNDYLFCTAKNCQFSLDEALVVVKDWLRDEIELL